MRGFVHVFLFFAVMCAATTPPASLAAAFAPPATFFGGKGKGGRGVAEQRLADNAWFHPARVRPDAPDTVYGAEIGLFAAATRLSYVSTHGGYFVPSEANATLPGWTRVATADPPEGGMRAIAFVQGGARMLIAFRGTDLTNCTGGHADVCADMMLWDGVPFEALPREVCGVFSAELLDYFAAARRFAFAAAAAHCSYPRCTIMYTGHSLGAGLALLLAASAQAGDPPTLPPGGAPLRPCAPTNAAGAVVFATPRMMQALVNRSDVNASTLDATRLVIFGDRFDPVFYSALHTPENVSAIGGVLGSVCEFDNGTQSIFCAICEADPQMNPLHGSVACAVCMMERHTLLHYLQLIRAGVTPRCVGSGPINKCTEPFLVQACAPRGVCGD